jgi:type I site-specific restriction-modification system R (restriction) subunit
MPTTAPMVSVTERTLNGTSDVLRAFRLPGPALLIVCAKLETGFDEPRVCCLCVDRTLRGAHAVQVLGRANRAAPHKPPVRVLDFVNSAAEIGAAFRGYVHATTRPLAEHEVIA